MKHGLAWQALQLVFLLLVYSAAAVRVLSARQVTCTALPPDTANTKPWPHARCKDVPAGFKCRARCTSSSDMATAVCQANGRWQTSTSCPPMPVACSGSPSTVLGASWGSCKDKHVGTACRTTGCHSGFLGTGYASTCLPSGQWSVPLVVDPGPGVNTSTSRTSSSSSSSSTGCIRAAAIPEAACQGQPPAAPKATWDAVCVNTVLAGGTCTASCSPDSSLNGEGYSSTCTSTSEWTTPVGSGCQAEASTQPPPQCSGQPPAVDGVTWGKCDTIPGGAQCYGFCKQPFRGMGYYTFCNQQGQWEVPQKQLKNDVGCIAVSCGAALPSSVINAIWDASCLGADASKSVCFAYCTSNRTRAAYMAECAAETSKWSEPPFKLDDC